MEDRPGILHTCKQQLLPGISTDSSLTIMVVQGLQHLLNLAAGDDSMAEAGLRLRSRQSLMPAHGDGHRNRRRRRDDNYRRLRLRRR